MFQKLNLPATNANIAVFRQKKIKIQVQLYEKHCETRLTNWVEDTIVIKNKWMQYVRKYDAENI